MMLPNPKARAARTTPLSAAWPAAVILVACALQAGSCIAASAQAGTAEPSDARGRDTARPKVAAAIRTDHVSIPEHTADEGDQTVAGYPLGPGDRIKAVFYGRPDLNGEYQVREDGIISMPLLGHFRAGGMDIARIEKAMSEKLIEVSGHDAQVSLEISQRRPFYVLGYVNNPGSFPFQFGATVLHAVAMAGGHFRAPAEGGAVNTAREIAELARAQETLARALARKARLEAERDGRDTIVAPKRLNNIARPELVARLPLAEKQLMRERARTLEDTIAGQEALIALSKEQGAELWEQYQQVSKQADFTRGELENVLKLKGKGLVTSTRIFGIRTRAADYEAEARLIKSRIVQTRQTIENASARKTAARNERKIQIEEQLIQIDAQIAQEELLIRKSQRLLQEITGLSVSSAGQSPLSVSVSYEIVRREGGRNRVIAAEELTELLPGDILRVKTEIEDS